MVNFKDLKIDERHRFNDGDLELLGDISEYEILGTTFSRQGDDFDILLKHRDSDYPSLISVDDHSCIAYFYENAEDYFTHIKDNIYQDNINNGISYDNDREKFEFPYYLEHSFGYKD